MSTTLAPTMMQTYTGKAIDLRSFSADDVDIRDIAHALSIINRFTGHTRVPYSVAQHSVMVSRLVPQRYALWGLLHDASEAYLGDVARPLKLMLPTYKEMELSVQRAIAQSFGLEWPIPLEVHAADNRALLAEKRDLISVDMDWGINVGGEPSCGPINAFDWHGAKKLFEERYLELTQ